MPREPSNIEYFVKDGVCYNDGSIPCNLGCACDGCRYWDEKNSQKNRAKYMKYRALIVRQKNGGDENGGV